MSIKDSDKILKNELQKLNRLKKLYREMRTKT